MGSVSFPHDLQSQTESNFNYTASMYRMSMAEIMNLKSYKWATITI
jgi:hypothetical protein